MTLRLPSGPSLRDDEFALFQALIRREAGIALNDQKKALLVSRLAPRLRALGLHTFTDYYGKVTGPDAASELVRMLDCICTNETRFFREPAQFELLEQEVIPSWIRDRPRSIRAWSAACSTGEEPYSVAMSMLHHLPPAGFSADIQATDLSTRALDHARRATWPRERAAEIPAAYLHTYMLEGTGPQQGKMKVGPEIRALVTFRRMNLVEQPRVAPGPFDLILCRNVLIYFDAATRARVLDRLLRSLRPGGYLFLGLAEALRSASHPMENIAPAVYRKSPRR